MAWFQRALVTRSSARYLELTPHARGFTLMNPFGGEPARYEDRAPSPDQDWPLRVTQVYRREGSDWLVVHRHADPLVHDIGLEQAAALARG